MSTAAVNIITSLSPLPADNIKPVITKTPLLTIVAKSTEEKQEKIVHKEEEQQLPQQGYIKYPSYDFF